MARKTKLAVSVIPLVTRPRVELGSDWGRSRKVLVRFGDKEIQIIQGHTAWSGVGSRSYYAQHVELFDYMGVGKYRHPVARELGLEGRVTPARLKALLPKIEEFLGIKFPQIEQVSIHHTLEITYV